MRVYPIPTSVACLLLLMPAATDAKGGMILNFESISPGEAIRNQFRDLGLTFEPGLFGDPFPSSTIQGSREATNFFDSGSITNPITAHFSLIQTRVEFLVAGNGDGNDTIVLRALSGVTQVGLRTLSTGTTVLPGGSLPSVLASIDVARGFDRLEVRRTDGNGAFSIDDFQFTAVAEPSTLVLLCMGAVGLLACAWRKRRRQ